jgi:hypothetical protein
VKVEIGNAPTDGCVTPGFTQAMNISSFEASGRRALGCRLQPKWQRYRWSVRSTTLGELGKTIIWLPGVSRPGCIERCARRRGRPDRGRAVFAGRQWTLAVSRAHVCGRPAMIFAL